MKFLIVILCLIFFSCTTLGDQSIQEKKINNIKEKSIKTKEINEEIKIKDTEVKLETQKQCNVSGQRLVYSHKFMSSALSFSSKVDKWLKSNVFYLKQRPKKQCPKHCEQVNNYRVLAKAYPEKARKGSCKGDQAKESYTFEKQFPLDKAKILESHKNMQSWILGTFVYPYIPLSILEPTPEAIDNSLSEACPSCSFYLDYNYKYTKARTLDLKITARCGDIRKYNSKIKVEYVLINNWNCKLPDKKDNVAETVK